MSDERNEPDTGLRRVVFFFFVFTIDHDETRRGDTGPSVRRVYRIIYGNPKEESSAVPQGGQGPVPVNRRGTLHYFPIHTHTHDEIRTYCYS